MDTLFQNINEDLTTYNVWDSLSVHLTQILIVDIWTGEIKSNRKNKYLWQSKVSKDTPLDAFENWVLCTFI